MMGHRERFRGGEEIDVVYHWCYRFKPGTRRQVKAKMNRRYRRQQRRILGALCCIE